MQNEAEMKKMHAEYARDGGNRVCRVRGQLWWER